MYTNQTCLLLCKYKERAIVFRAGNKTKKPYMSKKIQLIPDIILCRICKEKYLLQRRDIDEDYADLR